MESVRLARQAKSQNLTKQAVNIAPSVLCEALWLTGRNFQTVLPLVALGSLAQILGCMHSMESARLAQQDKLQNLTKQAVNIAPSVLCEAPTERL
jgi:hypothetical protein